MALQSTAEQRCDSHSGAVPSRYAMPQPTLGTSSASSSMGISTDAPLSGAHMPLEREQHGWKHCPNFPVSFSHLCQLNSTSVLGIPQRCIASADELGLKGLYIRPVWLSGYYQLKTWCFPLSTLKCVSSFYLLCACVMLWKRQPGLFASSRPTLPTLIRCSVLLSASIRNATPWRSFSLKMLLQNHPITL